MSLHAANMCNERPGGALSVRLTPMRDRAWMASLFVIISAWCLALPVSHLHVLPENGAVGAFDGEHGQIDANDDGLVDSVLSLDSSADTMTVWLDDDFDGVFDRTLGWSLASGELTEEEAGVNFSAPAIQNP